MDQLKSLPFAMNEDLNYELTPKVFCLNFWGQFSCGLVWSEMWLLEVGIFQNNNLIALVDKLSQCHDIVVL